MSIGPEIVHGIWQQGTYGLKIPCGVCKKTKNIRHGQNGEWALCDQCNARGYTVVRVNRSFEYPSFSGTFSGSSRAKHLELEESQEGQAPL